MRRPAESSLQPARLIWQILITLCLASGLGALIFSFLSFEPARSLADLLARDGSLDSFTQPLFSRLLLPLRLAGFLLLAFGAFLWARPLQWQAFLSRLPELCQATITRYLVDTRATFANLSIRVHERRLLFSLFGLTVFAFLARVFFINAPMQHDEAYNFSVFAIEPLRNALSDYHYPNNHLLNTLLMHITFRLFGAVDWAVRLPAFSAGVLLAPAGYLLARRLYNQEAALLAGAAIAASPVLIAYSVNARGYSLVALFSLLAFGLAVILRKHANTFLWSLLAATCALGMYAVPVFLYPAGVIFTWLGCVWLFKAHGPQYSRASFLAAAVSTGLASGLLSLLFYLPVIRASGLDAVTANPWVTPVARDLFWPTLLSRLPEIWAEWTQDVSAPVSLLALAGFALSMVYYKKSSSERVPLQAGLLFIPLMLLLQRPNPWPKLWLFLVPFLLIWAAGGLVFGLQALHKTFKTRVSIVTTGVVLLIGSLLLASLQYSLNTYPRMRPQSGAVEQAARYLRQHLQEGQLVVVTAIDDAPFWYYALKYDIPRDALRRDRAFQSAYVLVNRSLGQSLESVIAERGPDSGFFDWDSAAVVAAYGSIDLHLISANQQVIEREYGGQP